MSKKNIIETLNLRKIQYMFPSLQSITDYKNLKINTEGLYSITAYKYADMMSKIIYDLFENARFCEFN